jgi:ligand-binding sensor domain-containing protein
MTKNKLKNSIFSLLLVSIFFMPCKGQVSTNQKNSTIDSAYKTKQHPKIVRTLGKQFENVICQLLDNDGNLWFSISGEGVYRYDGKLFTNFTTQNGLSSNNVGSIIQDKNGNILLGTSSGISKYNGKTFTKYPVPNTLSITSMLEDKKGNLWFGTLTKGIYRYDGKTLDNFLNSSDPIYNLVSTNQLILDILQDKNGNIWFSSWNGGGVWRFDGKDFKNFLPSENYYKANQDKRNTNNPDNAFELTPIFTYTPSNEHITDDMIYSMMEDDLGNIWFATRNHGICVYNGKTFTTIGGNEDFDKKGVTGILQVDKNSFWITTFDSGVWYYNGKKLKNLTKNDGLVNNAVMSLIKDKDGNIWFGTKWIGLSRYDGKTFTTFSQYEN